MAHRETKPLLTVLRGLPGSGKSTVAEEYVVLREHTARVNKDSIRAMTVFQARGEKRRRAWNFETQFQEIELQAARVLLRAGLNVVVDDTNLKDSHVEMWKQLARDEKANFEVVSCLDVPIEECVRRDALRPDGVGRGVIYALAASCGMIESGNTKFECDRKYILCDIDGTLANIDHRVHFIQNGNADWDNFFAAMDKDEPREHVIAMLTDCYPDHPVVLTTGRWEAYRLMTEEWLRKHKVRFDHLLMRNPNDKRPDWVVKGEWLEKYLEPAKIEAVIDDRPSVVRMWQASGIKCHNVGDGKEF